MPLSLHRRTSFLHSPLVSAQYHLLETESFPLSCQAATVLQAAFRGHLARSKLLRNKAPDSKSLSLPGLPNQVTIWLGEHQLLDPSSAEESQALCSLLVFLAGQMCLVLHPSMSGATQQWSL